MKFLSRQKSSPFITKFIAAFGASHEKAHNLRVLRVLRVLLLPILLLALIGVACPLFDQGRPTPVTASTGDGVNLPPTVKPGDNIPTHQAELRLATPSPTQDSSPMNPGGKYLFIEFWNLATGTGTLPLSAIDFPHYYFDPTNGTLSSNTSDSITLSPTDLGFIGKGTSLSGAVGMGTASGLTIIDQLPYSIKVYIYTRQADQQATPTMEETRAIKLTVLSVAEDGTISIVLDGQTMALVPGQSWKQTIEKDVKTDQYNGHLTLTSTLTNYGWQERANINTSR